MATLSEMSQRLLNRFKNVPNVTIEDATEWTDEAVLEHGYKSAEDVPTDKQSLILLFAQLYGTHQIAIATAHYFTYTDGEEQVDKSMVSEQYRKLALELKTEYERKKAATSGTSVAFMRRIDRP